MLLTNHTQTHHTGDTQRNGKEEKEREREREKDRERKRKRVDETGEEKKRREEKTKALSYVKESEPVVIR